TANHYLTNLQQTMAELDNAEEKIKLLKNQPHQLTREQETALHEANQKIRDQEKTISDLKTSQNSETMRKLQAENKKINKTITNLKEQTNTSPQPKTYLFTFNICEQNKKSQILIAKVNELSINPHNKNIICNAFISKDDIIKLKKEQFF